jgi:hypothetical protein
MYVSSYYEIGWLAKEDDGLVVVVGKQVFEDES